MRWNRSWWVKTSISIRPCATGRSIRAQYLRIIRNHGSHRILLGSDAPGIQPNRRSRGCARSGLTDAEERRILGENAAALLGLS